MKSSIITLLAGFVLGIVLYHFIGKSKVIEKPVIKVDSTYYWINASQIDTLKHLRARVDSFQISARKRSVTISVPVISRAVSRIDTPQIASNEPVLYNIFEMDTVLSRGMDSNAVSVSFTEYPYAHFGVVSKWNDDHILVKERVVTVTLPPKTKRFTTGFSVGPGVGLITKQFDLFVGVTFTYNF